MASLNKEFVRLGEGRDGTRKDGLIDELYDLESSVNGFALHGNINLVFYVASVQNDVQVLIRNLAHINRFDIAENLRRFKLGVYGIVVPEERTGSMEGFRTVSSAYFRVRDLNGGSAYRIESPVYRKKGEPRVDYIFSPDYPGLDKFLANLGAPEEFILRD